MNHKRKRPKSRRAGCLMCKYWKHQGESKRRLGMRRANEFRRDVDAEQQLNGDD